MTDRKTQLSKAKMPSVGNRIKKKLNKILEEKVSTPLHEAGYENLGPGLAAAGSAIGDMFIPESMAELAMAVVPGALPLKAAGKALKAAKALKKIPTRDSKATFSGLSEAAEKSTPRSKQKLAKLWRELVFEGGPKLNENKAAKMADAVELMAKRKGLDMAEIEDMAYEIFKRDTP